MKYLWLLIMFVSIETHAQVLSDYYENKPTVTAGGITYKVKYVRIDGTEIKAIFRLSNIENELISKGLKYQDGSDLLTEEEYQSISATTDDEAVTNIVREVLGDIRITMLRRYDGAPLKINFVVMPDGTTKEVSFTLTGIPWIYSIPPAQFAAIEKRLKEVRWCLNEQAKKMQFIHTNGFLNFKFVALSSELQAIDKGDDPSGSGLIPIE